MLRRDKRIFILIYWVKRKFLFYYKYMKDHLFFFKTSTYTHFNQIHTQHRYTKHAIKLWTSFSLLLQWPYRRQTNIDDDKPHFPYYQPLIFSFFSTKHFPTSTPPPPPKLQQVLPPPRPFFLPFPLSSLPFSSILSCLAGVDHRWEKLQSPPPSMPP